MANYQYTAKEQNGRAITGTLQGEQLTRLVSVEAYWYAWSAIFPETRIWEP